MARSPAIRAEQGPRVRATAFRAPGNKVVVVAINNWAADLPLDLDLRGLVTTGPGEQVVTAEGVDRARSPLAIAGAGPIRTTIRAASVTTIVVPVR